MTDMVKSFEKSTKSIAMKKATGVVAEKAEKQAINFAEILKQQFKIDLQDTKVA